MKIVRPKFGVESCDVDVLRFVDVLKPGNTNPTFCCSGRRDGGRNPKKILVRKMSKIEKKKMMNFQTESREPRYKVLRTKGGIWSKGASAFRSSLLL